MIQKWYAESLAEYYEHIATIANMNGTDDKTILWFRGHEYRHFNLIPSILRSTDCNYNCTKTYSVNHLREDYRFQHFTARNYDKLDAVPTSVMEWQQVMQHYFTKTRLMDWSESAEISIAFALEAYLNPLADEELKKKRMNVSPTVWILEPLRLNECVYDIFATKVMGTYPLIEHALEGLENSRKINKVAKIIGDELAKKESKKIYFSTGDLNEKNINGLISLSALEFLKKSYSGTELLYRLEKMELNPFFYLLLRYYSDGLPIEQEKLPPLATIHPYYSPRIQAQKGAFTTFPHYLLNEQSKEMIKNNVGISPLAMEYIPMCQPFIHKIEIVNPARVGKELVQVGQRRSNLYPESEIISKDMENAMYPI